MRVIFEDKKFLTALFSFILLNLFLYLFIYYFHNQIPYHKVNYLYSAHHFLEDPKAKGGKFNFLRSLGQYDAQWYLKIASDGYAKDPKDIPLDQYRGSWEVLSYAFFPLYPLILSIVNIPFQNIELTAFIISNVLMIINFASLYYVVSKLFNEQIAKRSCFLLFLFPFSVFYRSYYTEGLYLFLLIWFSYFLVKKNFVLSGLSLGLMNITRGNGYLLYLVFLYYLWQEISSKKYSLKSAFLATILSILPTLSWILFNFVQTGNPIYFFTTHSNWFKSNNIFTPLFQNLSNLFSFERLYFHAFHSSKVDILITLLGFSILIKSKKELISPFWWISLSLWILPVLFKEMSLSRYPTVIFPFFIYLASKLKNTSYGIVLGIFSTLLFITALYFINWYWIG